MNPYPPGTAMHDLHELEQAKRQLRDAFAEAFASIPGVRRLVRWLCGLD